MARVNNLVVLAWLLRATTIKRSSTFSGKKSAPPQRRSWLRLWRRPWCYCYLLHCYTEIRRLLWLSSKVTVAVSSDSSNLISFIVPPPHLRLFSRNITSMSFLVPGGISDNWIVPGGTSSWAAVVVDLWWSSCVDGRDTVNTRPPMNSIWPRCSTLSATARLSHKPDVSTSQYASRNGSLINTMKPHIVSVGASLHKPPPQTAANEVPNFPSIFRRPFSSRHPQKRPFYSPHSTKFISMSPSYTKPFLIWPFLYTVLD